MGFTLFGIRTTIDNSFLFFVFLIIFLNPSDVLARLWLSLVLLFAVVGHEYCHALMARSFGFATDKITIYLFGGMAHIKGTRHFTPKEEFYVAFAGPAFNLVFGSTVYLALLFFGDLLGPIIPYLNTFTMINMILGLFNLMPAYPMDGGRILLSMLSTRMSRTFALSYASSTALLFAVAFVLVGISIGELMLPIVGAIIFMYNYRGVK